MKSNDGFPWGRPLTRELLVCALDRMAQDLDVMERDKKSFVLTEDAYNRRDWELGLLLGFLMPCGFDGKGSQQAVLQPHFQIYRQHLSRNSALSLDLGNLWYLHWLLATNELSLWGWAISAIQAGNPDGINVFNLEELVDRYALLTLQYQFQEDDGEEDDSLTDSGMDVRAYLATALSTYAPGGLFEPLGLIEWEDVERLGGLLKRKRPYHLPLRLVVFATAMTYGKWMGGEVARHRDGRITVNFLHYAEGSPGAVFCLPHPIMRNIARDIQDLSDVYYPDQHGKRSTGPIFKYFPYVADDPYSAHYAKARNCGCIVGEEDEAWRIGESIWENMYLLYFGPPYVSGPRRAFERQVFI